VLPALGALFLAGLQRCETRRKQPAVPAPRAGGGFAPEPLPRRSPTPKPVPFSLNPPEPIQTLPFPTFFFGYPFAPPLLAERFSRKTAPFEKKALTFKIWYGSIRLM